MSAERELVTVFRSADSTAKEDAEEVRELLVDAGLNPTLLGSNAPGVPVGAYEVRVPDSDAERADEVIADASEAPQEPGDPSHSMDVETVFSALGVTAEVEALGVRSVLDANGIPNVYVSPPQYPNLRFVVKVPKKYVDQAMQVLAEAREAGPEAADEAERAGE